MDQKVLTKFFASVVSRARGGSPETASEEIRALCRDAEIEIADLSLAINVLLRAFGREFDRVRQDSRVVHCSFCAKSQKEVIRIVQGPTASICDACAEICVEVMAEPPSA
jgi:hypothetical protein